MIMNIDLFNENLNPNYFVKDRNFLLRLLLMVCVTALNWNKNLV